MADENPDPAPDPAPDPPGEVVPVEIEQQKETPEWKKLYEELHDEFTQLKSRVDSKEEKEKSAARLGRYKQHKESIKQQPKPKPKRGLRFRSRRD